MTHSELFPDVNELGLVYPNPKPIVDLVRRIQLAKINKENSGIGTRQLFDALRSLLKEDVRNLKFVSQHYNGMDTSKRDMVLIRENWRELKIRNKYIEALMDVWRNEPQKLSEQDRKELIEEIVNQN